MKPPNESMEQTATVAQAGPWPFVTSKVVTLSDGAQVVLQSRHHRKGLSGDGICAAPGSFARCLWMPGQLNWWIGVVFATGSVLFAVAGVLSLAPELARAWSLSPANVNAIFFAGSIPFTTAAYLQLNQAANAPGFARHEQSRSTRMIWLGWRPREIGWLSAALQFIGTLLFNLSTFDAMSSAMNPSWQDRMIWLPDIVGSVFFLVAGYLAFIETCHAHWAWKPRSLSWWVTFANLLGCIAFMISAVFAYVPEYPSGLDAAAVSVAFTLAGAIGFLTGSLLMLPELVWTRALPRRM